jgi:hypothetical protein
MSNIVYSILLLKIKRNYVSDLLLRNKSGADAAPSVFLFLLTVRSGLDPENIKYPDCKKSIKNQRRLENILAERNRFLKRRNAKNRKCEKVRK